MSELAFTANGDVFDVPAVVTGWRVRRLKPRGAPELVYGRDGCPLVVPIETDMAALREAVGGIVAKYRLDPVGENGKVIEDVPAAYVQVVKIDEPAEVAPQMPNDRYAVVKEAMRLNTELAKAMVVRFPEMLRASAELLRAAEGAGLPSRPGCVVDDDEEDEPRTSGSGLISMLTPVVQMLASGLGGDSAPVADQPAADAPTHEPN